jgi:hypothetical protein
MEMHSYEEVAKQLHHPFPQHQMVVSGQLYIPAAVPPKEQ